LLAIPLLFELPAVLTTTALELSALRLSLDLPLVLTFWVATLGMQRRTFLIVALRSVATVLILYRVDQWVCWTLLRDEPLLYDQLFMLRHLWALIGDLMSVRTALVLGAVALSALLIGFAVRFLLRKLSTLGAPDRQRRTWASLALIWCLLLLLRCTQLANEDPIVSWLAPTIVSNVRKSAHTYASVQKRLGKSPYAAYQRIALRDKPDVLLFIVESYGRLLSVEEKTRAGHAALLAELETELTAAGFRAASAFATATVSGGRSWIAEGNILLGTPIRYEAMFQHIVAQAPPSFVSFLNSNGYQTALLAPADRDRAGFHPVNRYGFAQLFTYDQLAYRGPAIGWGLIPDQYSLAFIERAFLQSAQKPVFLDFHMVSSHAPWSEVPAIERNPAQLLATSGTTEREEPSGEPLDTAFRRYARSSGRFAYMDRFDDAMREGYQATVEYDLRVIAQFLARRSHDAFVIILGDHQPPVIAREDKSFDAPVHILSRDPARLTPLLKHAFVPGLTIDPAAPAALDQAGLFSLWVHALSAMRCSGCALPSVLVHGDQTLAP
jgi:hypothetical protein